MRNDEATLDAFPPRMADAVRPALARASIGGYRRFLRAMAHYTRQSGARLRHAAQSISDPELRIFFQQLSREEANHYKLAESDLARLDRTFPELADAGGDERWVAAPVGQFHDRWMSATQPSSWLGALVVLEGVGAHLAEDAATHLGRLGLSREHVSFVMTHLEADISHADGARQHAVRCGIDAPMLDAARQAAEFWVELHLVALDGAA